MANSLAEMALQGSERGTNEALKARKKRSSIWWDAYYRIVKDRVAVVCFFVLSFYVVMGVLAGFGVIFTDYAVTNDAIAYQAPSLNTFTSKIGTPVLHLAGTDLFGRDVLARAVHGIVTALSVGLIGAGIAVTIGVLMGSLAGYFGGKIDALVVWFYTTIDTVPYILLLAAFSLILGAGIQTLFLVIGLTSWVSLCRLIRAEFLKHREKDYVSAAHALGASHARRIFIHILPNVSHIVLINFSLIFVSAIKSEVILSYLGLGVATGTPSWGVMIDDAKQELARGVWWNLGTAWIFMFGLILSLSLFNDALRDALDPKLKNRT